MEEDGIRWKGINWYKMEYQGMKGDGGEWKEKEGDRRGLNVMEGNERKNKGIEGGWKWCEGNKGKRRR